jgi:hypothetical protein
MIGEKVMRKLLLALFVLAVGGVANAQESYSIPATASQVTDVTSIAIAKNKKTCVRLGLAIGCTQAQACTAANAAGGASCTAAQARNANARIFVSSTQAGREEYVSFQIVLPAFQDQIAAVPGQTQREACANWQTFNQTQKDAACTAAGITAPCTLFGSTCN